MLCGRGAPTCPGPFTGSWAVGAAHSLLYLHPPANWVVRRPPGRRLRVRASPSPFSVAWPELGEPASRPRVPRQPLPGRGERCAVPLGFCLPWAVPAAGPTPVVAVLTYLAAINTLVVLFQRPGLPLDRAGSTLPTLWAAAGSLRRAPTGPPCSATASPGCWSGVRRYMLFTGHVVEGVWLGLVGVFLGSVACQGSYEQVAASGASEGPTGGPVRQPPGRTVPPSLDLRHWVENTSPAPPQVVPGGVRRAPWKE